MPLLCPLDLVSKSPSDLELVSSRLLAPDKDPAIIRRFARWLETNTLLQQLRTYQEMLDQKGVLVGDVDDENFLVAMTLRDCTVFVRFPPEGSGREIEARLGDLDVKSSRKKDYWRSIELPLIEEGWYAGTENKEDRQPLICRLSPERWNKRREEKDS
jgi:inositol-pentakisphosphate 2-kinase